MIFFLIVLTVIILVNLYIFIRTRPFFPASGPGSWLSVAFFWIVALSYIAGRFAERAGADWLAIPLVKTGSWWLGAMVYLTLLFLLADFLRGFSIIPGLKSIFGFSWSGEKGKWVSIVIYAITGIVLLAGNLNSRTPVVIKQSLVIDKPFTGGKFRAVLASDLHLGMMISNGRLERVVNLINSQNADVILLAGDIFDEDLGSVIRNNLGDLLKNLKAKDGVFAILGNHEFYGNASEAQNYLENHHIVVMRDSAVILPSGVSIIGREDITSRQMFHRERKSLETLLAGVNIAGPVILMDHQPFDLKEAAKYPVDLQVSGHTHHGQLWPFNYITNAMYEISRGYGTINNTHFYVSPGVGTWGPPIRTSCRPEITVLEISGSAE